MIESICLSCWNESPAVLVPENIARLLKNFHIITLRFLYDAFVKERRGSILNVDFDMNIPLQVSAFLATLFCIETRDDVIIISHADNVLKWLYHLRNDANLNPIFLTEDVDIKYKGPNIFVVSIDNIDILKNYGNENIFCVIIENFELVCNKLLIRKLKGHFNIGITYKNFLLNRDAKIQYNMLHWLDPDKYKKKTNFIKESLEHFINLRDAYDEDWLRLTWNYSDTFKKTTLEEINNNQEFLCNWAKENDIKIKVITAKCKRKLTPRNKETTYKKCKEEIKKELSTDSYGDTVMLSKRSTTKKSKEIVKKALSTSSDDTDTDILDNINTTNDSITDVKSKFIQLPCMDETPMLNSIKENFSGKSKSERNNENSNVLDMLILSKDSVYKPQEKNENDYLNCMLDEDVSYKDLLDNDIKIDSEMERKMLSSLFD